MTFRRDDKFLWLSQILYISQILDRFGMANCKSVTTPMCTNQFLVEGEKNAELTLYQYIVGPLLYASTRTRLDISAAVGILCRHMADPKTSHLIAAKRVLRYLQCTRDYALRIGPEDKTLTVYSDADWAGDRVDRKSTSGILIKLGGAAIHWKSAKQDAVALYTCESEFFAASEACRLVIWLRKMLSELELEQKQSTKIFIDNQGALRWSTDEIRNAKHISIRRNFVKEQVEAGIVFTSYCPTNEMTADILTKPLNREKFETHREKLGLVRLPPPTVSKKGC